MEGGCQSQSQKKKKLYISGMNIDFFFFSSKRLSVDRFLWIFIHMSKCMFR